MAEEVSSLILQPELDSLTTDAKASADFSKETAELIPKSEALAKAGRLNEALDELMLLEKKTRQASDGVSSTKLVQLMLRLQREAGEWEKLNGSITLMSKKRGQLKRVIVDMVQLAMKWIEETPSHKEKLKLITTLSSVTEGKIFVEVERSRVVKKLAEIKEAEGDIESASQLLQDVQVETFGAMDRREKAEYILEQMRLVLARREYVRCQIIAKKINPKLLEAEDFQDIKRKFYELLIQMHIEETQSYQQSAGKGREVKLKHEQATDDGSQLDSARYLEISKSFYAIFETPSVKSGDWKNVLECYIIYLLLASFTNEQKDLLNKVSTLEQKRLEQLDHFKQLVSDFLKSELISWPLKYEADLRNHAVFTDSPHAGGDLRWNLFKKRVGQHDLMVISKYYTRITLDRLASLLTLSRTETEAEIAELVTSRFLQAKIDRPSGIVVFGGRDESTDRLNIWSSDIKRILDLTEESSKLVEKERMIHSAKLKKTK
uniref:PCI domain-containing protein n=2 Tax=Vitrella brassicaformis TaxID=1169539 RepID=A0A7S1K300_9ALVE